MNFAVLTPSRGRPARFERMATAAVELSDLAAEILLGLDNDDPYKHDYINANKWDFYYPAPRMSLSEWTNYLAQIALNRDFPPGYLVSMGDDHLVQTDRWHIELKRAILDLDGPGFAYGDDLMNGSGLCTSWMADARVVKALGWMMLPNCEHMFVDNAIMELGEATGRIAYVPNVIIEHLHPNADKAKIDDTYRSTNNEEQYERDLKAFRMWRYGPQFRRDVNKILELKYE